MKEKIYLYYTSDLHSHFENWPQIIGYFKDKVKKHSEADDNYWLLDNGDHVDRFHPITEGLMGKSNVNMLNRAGYHFANLGNNEGITLAHEDLYSLYDTARFDIICANLKRHQGEQPKWLHSHKIVSTKQGAKIGIIGLTAPFETFYRMLGWEIEDPYAVLHRELNQIAAEVDIVILLSHLGINDDEEMARRFPELDLIIGGHTHHLFKQGEVFHDTLVTAVGKHGTHLGEVILEWDHTNRELTRSEAYAVSTEYLDKDEDTNQFIEDLSKEASSYLRREIAYLPEPEKIAWFSDTDLMIGLVRQLQKWTDADVGMLNAGVLLDNLPKGKVTYEDVHRICPHPMNPCKVELSGDELLEVIRAGHSRKLTEIRLKGLGFRGEVIGKMVFTGVNIDTFTDSEGEQHVKHVTYQGRPLSSDETYSLATADTFTFGRLLPEIAYAQTKHYYMPELLRDLLMETLKDMGTGS
ncbi:bifunctional UDP-sugar hydrolase/5'-nucleotidase [Thalassobacillus sp. CUG 92003]|uniref:bifunctional metallophosphatase/5'-nucleotidase n=1 Tax=Thalassobacillus sp. CUG 92003 TaxID=2736641 RepID=UPI0015E76D91|nr:bifunctional UDP-sugar hydrolase/5'-nucleotidase [Thalassobacillus sp. CUG 92003]